MRKWQVGNFTITKVLEFHIELGLIDGLISQLTPAVVTEIDWLFPDYVNEAGQLIADVQSLVIDTGEHVIIADTGCGNGKSYPTQPIWSNLNTSFLERLREAGYEPEDIDIVLCTHAHLDHIGWMSTLDADGNWVPTFPNARLMMVRDEYERHLSLIIDSDEDAAGKNGAATVVEDDAEIDLIERAFLPDATALSEQTRLIQKESFQPLVDAGRLELLPVNGEIVPGVSYISTPGHTSAHHSIRLDSNGKSALITGDAFHHPIQIARPEWSSAGDWDAEYSARTRRALLEEAAGTDLLLVGTHFAGPTGGYIVADGDGYRLVGEHTP